MWIFIFRIDEAVILDKQCLYYDGGLPHFPLCFFKYNFVYQIYLCKIYIVSRKINIQNAYDL